MTVTSRPIRIFTNFMTLIPSFTFTELRVVSMKHKPAGNAYSSGHLVPFLFGTCLCYNFWGQFFLTCRVFSRRFTLNIPRYCLDYALDWFESWSETTIHVKCTCNNTDTLITSFLQLNQTTLKTLLKLTIVRTGKATQLCSLRKWQFARPSRGYA